MDKAGKKAKIGIFGLGYIGLPLLAVFAKKGFLVVGVDINPQKVEKLRQTYQAPIHEPGLNETLAENKNNIEFTVDQAYAMRECQTILITVGTPINEKKEPDYRDINNAFEAISKYIRKGQLIILKSTVLPGLTRQLAQKMEQLSGLKAGKDFYVVFCPERTLEGKALEELQSLPKIIGGINQESLERGVKIISKLGGKIIKVSCLEVAEMCKCIDNSYRLNQIAFANEIGEICEKAGLDAFEIVRAVNSAYSRTNLFWPGLGAGGPCLSKDPQILGYYARQNQVEPRVISASLTKSQESNERIIRLASQFIQNLKVKNPRVALLGLAFKGTPETDDLRGAPSLDFYNSLKKKFPKLTFRFYDPLVKEFLGNSVWTDLTRALAKTNLIIFLTNHPKLKNIDAGYLLDKASRPLLLIDCWQNISNLDKVKDKGVKIFRVGNNNSWLKKP